MPLFTTIAVCIILVEITSTSGMLPSTCPRGWLAWQQSCYILLPDAMDWYKASEACARPGSNLAIPESQEENDFIFESVMGQEVGLWLGCTAWDEDGAWLCGDKPPAFTMWYTTPPVKKSGLNCARMTIYNGRWSSNLKCDAGESYQKLVACEMAASNPAIYTTMTGPDGRVSPEECLTGHGMHNLTVRGLPDCNWACKTDPKCRSFNLWSTCNQEKMCQLNDVTGHVAGQDSFRPIKNCYYFDL